MNNLTTQNNRDVSSWSVFKDDLWDLFDRFSKDFDMPLTLGHDKFTPKIEVKDTGKKLQICAEVPGMDEKDINVTLRNNQLIIEGEKKQETKNEDKEKGYFHSELNYGSFYRAIPLGEDVDTEKVQATYKNGVLNVSVDKRPAKEQKTKKIEISH